MSSRLIPPKVGSSNWHSLDDLFGIVAVHLDIENIDIGKALEQNRLALHDRLSGQRANVSQAKNRRSIAEHGHKISAACVLVGVLRIFLDLETRLRYTGRVREAKIALSSAGLGGRNFNFPRA